MAKKPIPESSTATTMTTTAPSIGREQRMELIKRMLGLRHKLKVHETMKAPETHDELSQNMVGKWDLEDQIRAIEELLNESRALSVKAHRTHIQEEYLTGGDKKALKPGASK